MDVVCFATSGGSLGLFVKNLRSSITIPEVIQLFERNGFVPGPISVILSPSETPTTWAICTLSSPHQCRKALSMKYLADSSSQSPELCPLLNKEKSFLSLYQCEALLNHHFPLQWSSKVNFTVITDHGREDKKEDSSSPPAPPSPPRLLVSVQIYWKQTQILNHSSMHPIDVGNHNTVAADCKRAVGVGKRQALDQLEIVCFHDRQQEAILRRVQSRSVVVSV